MYALFKGFETLQKAFIKARAVIEKEGATPTFYIRLLVDMEDFISQVSPAVISLGANNQSPLFLALGRQRSKV